MFYQEKSIQSHLTCKICRSMYNDPRVLPCTHTFCNSCIADIKEDQTSSVTCPVCNVRHVYPASGFLFVKVLADLVAEQPREANQSQKLSELRKILNLLLGEHSSLSNRLNKGSEEVREHCQRLRNKVDIETEQRIEEIRQISDQFRQEIDKHELEFLRDYDEYGQNAVMNEIKPALSDVFDFYSRAVEFLNQSETQDEQVTKWIKESKKQRDLLKEKSFLLSKSMTFDNLDFERNESNLEPSLIGTLNLKVEQTPFSNTEYIEVLRVIQNFGDNKLLNK